MASVVNTTLEKISMYRLMAYYLISLIIISLVLSTFSLLSFSVINITSSTIFLLVVSYLANIIFARIFKATTNFESTFITALILSLIIGPTNISKNFIFLAVIAVVAISSKYLLAPKKRHVFNPAALASIFGGIFLAGGSSWWIGVSLMQPFILIGGFLILYKIKRLRLASVFFATYALALIFAAGILNSSDISILLPKIFFNSPILFFGSVMLIEPLTSPIKASKQLIYAVLVAVILVIYQSLLKNVPYTFELALLTGNVYALLANKNFTINLVLKQRRKIAKRTFEFVFEPMRDISFISGQFMLWTLSHTIPDSKGNRRYFTISSSPTQKTVSLTLKIPQKPSSFKRVLMKMSKGEIITVSRPRGKFILPADPKTKLVFIAGGIGITPFHSMIEFLLTKGQKRDIILIYANSAKSQIMYRKFLSKAKKEIGLNTHYLLTKNQGHLNSEVIKQWVPDYKDRTFYVSGPKNIVKDSEKLLKEIGVTTKQIKKDYFPGY